MLVQISDARPDSTGLSVAYDFFVSIFNCIVIYCSTVQDCSGRDFQQPLDGHFHFKVLRSVSYGHIEVLRLKENHAVDLNQLTIRINPIICHTGWCILLGWYYLKTRAYFSYHCMSLLSMD